jgi:hypothetical protein
MLDMNDAEPQKSGELIPDGTFAKISMTIRPGGIDGQGDTDKGLLKASNSPGSDVRLLDCEFTVAEGAHARRKFWQVFTVSGGKVDEQGVSIGWKISKSTFRAMIDSALGLNPEDLSDAAKQKRMLRGLGDLSGITFVGKIKIEPSDDERYGDNNKLDRVVLPSEAEWQKVMNGEAVPPAPSGQRRKSAAPKGAAPAWNQSASAQASPAWKRPASAPAAAASAPSTPPQTQAAKPAAQGPAWLNS